MKSFTEFLENKLSLLESEWKYDIPDKEYFESKKENQDKAKEIMTTALKGGNEYAEALDTITRKLSDGEAIPTDSGKEISDILQSIYVLSHMASKKNLSSDKEGDFKGSGVKEAKELLSKLEVIPDDPEEIKDNPLSKKGKEIISQKRKDKPEEETQKEETKKEETKKKKSVSKKKEKTPEVTDSEKESETDFPPKEVSSKKEKKSEEESEEESPKERKFVDSKGDPSILRDKAERMKKDHLEKLKSMLDDQEENSKRWNDINKEIKDFTKKSNDIINGIDKQTKKYEVHPTLSSKTKAGIEARKGINSMEAAITNSDFTFKSKDYKSSRADIAKQRVKDAASSVQRGVEKLGKTGIGRATKMTADAAGSLGKKGFDAMKSAAGKTAEYAKSKAPDVKEKIDSTVAKVKDGIVPASEKAKEGAQSLGRNIADKASELRSSFKQRLDAQKKKKEEEDKTKAKETTKKVMSQTDKNKILPDTLQKSLDAHKKGTA